jgi:hypothetical protein
MCLEKHTREHLIFERNKVMTTEENLRFEIRYGDVLGIFGVPHDFPLLLQHGHKIFDKRTKLHKQATKIRRQQLMEEYKLS